MRLLFIHGAGGYVEDQPLAHGLAARLGCDLELPRLPDEDMSVDAWAAPVRQAVASLHESDLLVGHSFGASILLRVLQDTKCNPGKATLLAMPDWSPAGWNVPAYALEGPEPPAALTMHHCRDDEIVPFDHLARHAERLPSARIIAHPGGGHQLDGRIDFIAAGLLNS